MNASGVMVGTALAPKDAVLVRMFQRAGFSSSHVGLFKSSNDIIDT